jgi:hypothetical protein
MVHQAKGWELSPGTGHSERLVQPKPWLRDPVEAHRHLDDAAEAVMGPFAPVDAVAMAMALLGNEV